MFNAIGVFTNGRRKKKVKPYIIPVALLKEILQNVSLDTVLPALQAQVDATYAADTVIANVVVESQQPSIATQAIVANVPLEPQQPSSVVAPEAIPQPVAEPIAQPNGLGEKKISALSLSSIRARRELESSLEKIVVNPENLPKEPFSFEQLMAEWNWYADKLSRNGLMLMCSLMGMTQPRLSGTRIDIALPNQGSKLSFDEQKFDLVNFLRKKLRNFDIEIRIEVNEEIQLVKKVFDAKDKYEHFVATNSNMELLREMFDLELR